MRWYHWLIIGLVIFLGLSLVIGLIETSRERAELPSEAGKEQVEAGKEQVETGKEQVETGKEPFEVLEIEYTYDCLLEPCMIKASGIVKATRNLSFLALYFKCETADSKVIFAQPFATLTDLLAGEKREFEALDFGGTESELAEGGRCWLYRFEAW